MTDRGNDTSTDDRRKERAADEETVRFVVKPKVVVTETGPAIRFQLSYRGMASIDVGFRMSWKGELLDVQGPTLSLTPGAKPYDVSLSLPLDSGIGRGSKVKVSVVGRGGEVYAVSSTGVVSMSLPGGRTLALGAQGVTASLALAGGIVVGAVTYPWGDDDPPTQPSTTVQQAGPTTEVEVSGAVPVIVPGELIALVDATPDDPDLPVDLYPFGQPDPVIVALDERPEGASSARVFAVTVGIGSATHPIGEVQLPSSVDPSSGGLPDPLVIAADGVPLLEVGTGTSFVCFDRDTFEVRGGYRTTTETGLVQVTLTPVEGDGWVSVVATVLYGVASELSTVPGVELDEIDPDDCDVTRAVDGFAWESELPTFDDAAATDDDSHQDDKSVDDDGDDGESPAAVEFAAEPTSGLLELGDEGDRVRALQEGLAGVGLYGDEVDGRYGSATEAAVRRLQEIEGLTVDGLAGPATHEALDIPYAAIDGDGDDDGDDGDTSEQTGSDDRTEPATGPLELGHEGERVAALQTALTASGFFDGVVDGQFGPATEAALRSAQEALGLDVDGVAGPATHEALGLDYP